MQLASGSPTGLGALLTLLHPASGSYTCTLIEGSHKIIGQVVYRMKQRPARLSFLLPENELTSVNLTPVLEALLAKAGEMGAMCVLAELPETHPALETFRRCGFTIYAWQHIWKMPAARTGRSSHWQEYHSDHELNVRLLYQSLVPPLVQCNEQPFPNRTPAWIVKREGELVAYAEAHFGTHGVILNSLFHPEVADIKELVIDLASRVNTMSRPLYLAVRLYQAHLEPALEKLGAEQYPMQALLVRHLASPVLEEAAERQRKVAHAHQAEPTAPFIDSQ